MLKRCASRDRSQPRRVNWRVRYVVIQAARICWHSRRCFLKRSAATLGRTSTRCHALRAAATAAHVSDHLHRLRLPLHVVVNSRGDQSHRPAGREPEPAHQSTPPPHRLLHRRARVRQRSYQYQDVIRKRSLPRSPVQARGRGVQGPSLLRRSVPSLLRQRSVQVRHREHDQYLRQGKDQAPTHHGPPISQDLGLRRRWRGIPRHREARHRKARRT